MHAVRRRKKRPNNGIRTIEVCRGSNGFGFTISGQQPCILSCIVRDSPAERAGLRSGDYLVAVNGQNVSKTSHDDVVRLIGSSCGLLKLQIAENYYSDSSDEDNLAQARSKPKHHHNRTRGGKGRVAKVVRDLRTGAMFDQVEEAWDVPALPPPRIQCAKEELCFFLGYLGTIEMPQLLPPGSRCQVVRCCVKRLRAEKRTHTSVVMRVHAEGVTLTGSGGAVIAHYPVHRLCYAGPGAEQDKKYIGLVTAAPAEDDATPSSSCHVFAVQSSLSDHEKHSSKCGPFRVNCTSGPLSDGCFEFPSTSEPVLNAVRSFCLTKEEEEQVFENDMMLANSPQPSHAGSTAASSNSDSGIGFRDDGNQSDRIVMVDVENQRLHIQQICDGGQALDIQLGGKDGRSVQVQLNGPSANLQQAFACVNALCPRSPSSDDGQQWAEHSVLYRLGILPDYPSQKFSESKKSKSCDQLYCDEPKFSPQVYSRSPFSLSYGQGDVLLHEAMPSTSRSQCSEEASGKTIFFTSADDESQKLLNGCGPRVAHSLEELAAPPPPPPVWGSLQDLPSVATSASEDKNGKLGEKEEGLQAWATSFERLVDDPYGLETFTNFLKKEFSEENMIFWLACSKYEKTNNPAERRRMAREIYSKHLAEGAPEPVNVDAHARSEAKAFLDSEGTTKEAPTDLFYPAQKQVFNLMKFDSFPRFLKSDLYQEMCKRPAAAQPKCRPDDGRRKSLLPWSRKMRAKSKDRCSSGGQEMADDAVSLSSKSSVTSWDLTRGMSFSRQSSIGSKEGGADRGLVRILLTDGATAVVQIRDGETVRELMERVLAKRGIQYNAFEVFVGDENKARSLDGPACELANHDVRLDQRVLFKVDLPNRKTISVKAKTNKTLGQVLRPVLHKYNYAIEMVAICSMSENEVIELAVPITTVDGRRLTVLTRNSDFVAPLPPANCSVKTFIRPHASLDEITNKVFEELLASKSSSSSAGGSIRSEASSSTIPLPMPRFLRMRRKGASNPAPPRSDTDDLYEGLKRAQRSRLEDQRGTEINFELPDFLKDKENNPQGVCKIRKIREEGTSEARASPEEGPTSIQPESEAKPLTCKTYETASSKPVPEAVSRVRKEPPPLPPKPKCFRPPAEPPLLRNQNFLKADGFAGNRRAVFIDDTSSSFV